MSQINVFDYAFNDVELQQEFENFFIRNDLLPLFSNEHRSTPIKVSWIDARSILSENGAYRKAFLDLSEVVNMATGNKKYEQAVFKMIYESRSLQKLKNISQKVVNKFIETTNKSQDNFWNIVFYTKDVY